MIQNLSSSTSTPGTPILNQIDRNLFSKWQEKNQNGSVEEFLQQRYKARRFKSSIILRNKDGDETNPIMVKGFGGELMPQPTDEEMEAMGREAFRNTHFTGSAR